MNRLGLQTKVFAAKHRAKGRRIHQVRQTAHPIYLPPLSVSPVTADKLPMAPPAGGAQFGVPAWTVQPAGTRFDPPIEVTLPNASSQPAGDNLPIVQLDHDLGQYVAMGRATVSEDGSVLITDSGSGLIKAGWVVSV
jgi:large repetitive protein